MGVVGWTAVRMSDDTGCSTRLNEIVAKKLQHILRVGGCAKCLS
jgi:hypothetical protein